MSVGKIVTFAVAAVVATAIGIFIINKIPPLQRIVYGAQ